jgi:predicted transcriptional regulator
VNTARVIQKHRTLIGFVNRGPIRDWLSRRVWAEAMADPAFVEGLERGKADFEAGRVVPWAEVKKQLGKRPPEDDATQPTTEDTE